MQLIRIKSIKTKIKTTLKTNEAITVYAKLDKNIYIYLYIFFPHIISGDNSLGMNVNDMRPHTHTCLMKISYEYVATVFPELPQRG